MRKNEEEGGGREGGREEGGDTEEASVQCVLFGRPCAGGCAGRDDNRRSVLLSSSQRAGYLGNSNNT